MISFFGIGGVWAEKNVYIRPEKQYVPSTSAKTENLSLVVHGAGDLPGRLPNTKNQVKWGAATGEVCWELEFRCSPLTEWPNWMFAMKRTMVFLYKASTTVLKIRASNTRWSWCHPAGSGFCQKQMNSAQYSLSRAIFLCVTLADDGYPSRFSTYSAELTTSFLVVFFVEGGPEWAILWEDHFLAWMCIRSGGYVFVCREGPIR